MNSEDELLLPRRVVEFAHDPHWPRGNPRRGSRRSIRPQFEHLNAIWKNVYSIVVAPRRVFTPPRP